MTFKKNIVQRKNNVINNIIIDDIKNIQCQLLTKYILHYFPLICLK